MTIRRFSDTPIVASVALTNVDQVSAASGLAVVHRATLGSVFLAYQPMTEYQAASEIVRPTLIRWPGGSMAENCINSYSLRFDDIVNEANPGDADYDAGRQRGLTEVLAQAVSTHADFSMVLPTRRYMTNVSEGTADLKAFLVRLLNGEFGDLPRHVTLEIGNESSWVGWHNGHFTPGEGSYGYIANAFLETIRTTLANTHLNPHHIDIDVAVQMGTSIGAGQTAVFNQISDENLRTVDYFIRHSALVWNDEAHNSETNPNGYDFAYEQSILSQVHSIWLDAWGGQRAPQMRIFDSEWNVGGAGTIAEVGGSHEFDFGARQAPAIIEIFSQMIAGGSDACSVWGLQDKASALFGLGGTALSYGGHAFRLMAESLAGTHLVAGKIHEGQWTHTDSRYDVIAYQDDAKVVLFVAAGDLPHAGMNVNIDLSDFGQFAFAWGESISAPEGQADPNNPANAFDVEVSRFALPVNHQGGHEHVTVSLSDDNEVVRVILARENPGAGRLQLFGSAGSDDIDGGSSNDLLLGNRGGDDLQGGRGADWIRGGGGADLINGGMGVDRIFGGRHADQIAGGAGDDVLRGGMGNDAFIFNTTADLGDRIVDFGADLHNNDRLRFDADLFNGLGHGHIDADCFALNAAQDADDRFIYVSDSHELYYDPDGTGTADAMLLATFGDHSAAVTASDILLF